MADAAALAGALGAALLVLATSRGMLAAGLALAVAAIAVLAADEGTASSPSTLLDSAAGIAAIGGALVVLAATAAVLVRWPVAILPLLLAVSPLRPPLATDPDSPVLLGFAGTGGLGRLYPLYAALTAAVIALAWRTARGAPVQAVPRALAVPTAVFLALTIASFLWSDDRSAATRDVLFLWLPFTVLLAAAARAPFTARSPRLLTITLVGIAALLAGIAVWQAASEELLFFTVSLEQANELGSLFRVTAAFQDPNHLGRHLVMAIGVLLVGAWCARITLPATIALLGLLGVGLWFTYSQSSLVTLAVVALAVALAATTGRTRRVVAVATAALVACAMVAVGVLLATGASDDVTSDRSSLVSDTGTVAAAHPIVGVGVSSQPFVTQRDESPEASKLQSVSHNTPLTVAAELGVVGLFAFVAVLAGAATVLAEVARRDRAVALGVSAVLLVLVVHSLFYAGLFENPITWIALGVAAVAASTRRGLGGERSGLRLGGEWRAPLRS